MSKRESSEAVLEAREALRKLSGDLAIYRDPEVQRHLQHLTPESKRQLESCSSAQLKALIIALRTELHESEEDRERSKSAALDARKRAARAEGQIEELTQQLSEKEVEHDEVVKQASERIEALEKESEFAAQSASDRALILQETIERDRLGNAGFIAEKDQFRTQAKEARSKVSALQRELEAAEQRHHAEMSMLLRGKDIAESKIAGLQEEVEYLEGAVSKRTDDPGEQEARDLSKKLQRENTQLKSEIASQSKEMVTLKSQHTESHNSLKGLKQQIQATVKDKAELMLLREEVESLRKYKRRSASTADHVAALTREKEELSRLIRNLSPTGDVQEGLQILKASNAEGQAVGKLISPEINDLARKNQELADMAKRRQTDLLLQTKVIQEVTKRSQVAEGQLVQVRVERDEALAAGKRHERIRGILEYEKTFFKQALEKIEAEFDKPQNTDDYPHRLQKRSDMYEQSCEKYQSAVKDLEASLNESRKKTEKLAADLAQVSSASREQLMKQVTDASKVNYEMMEALQSAKSALDAKVKAMAASKKFEERAKELEAEVQRLRQSQSEGELDYDPSLAKVVHMKDNPFVQAVRNAAKEQEIKAGKKRMRMELGESSPGRGPAVDSRMEALRNEIQELEEKNDELAKKSKVGIRLGEVAKKKIEEVRAVVYNLFGWSMNVYGAKYKITSIYAEGPKDVLEFGMNESGTMTLMETDYTSRLLEEIEQYVQKMNSIPALLANITIENFEKTTSFV